MLATLLRDHPTLPADPRDAQVPWLDVASGGRLPPVSCAFKGCMWHGGGRVNVVSRQDDAEHPWDQELRGHILETHGEEIQRLASTILEMKALRGMEWDLYKEALAVKERLGVPIVGPSVDRRAMEHLTQV